ncbi:MAG: peptidoglycan DD-metalloendopeptidase family protein [Thermoleophilia bacterium]|nr:peptidoglycan DD-metalloendopeptidase family protein [Thermoleophilia bacterium]
MAAAAPEKPAPLNFKLGRGTVSPKQAVPDSVRPQRIVFRFRASRPTPIEIRVIKLGSGRTVRRFATSPLQPGRWHRVDFDGLDRKGRLAGPGKYRVRVGPLAGRLEKLSRLKLHGHRVPVVGPHGTRGAIGAFGAPRTDGRTHEGFDITANCGRPLVAVRSGTILERASEPELKGNYVVMKGRSERRTYLYAHLRRPATVKRGQRVRAGHRLGSVGQTGNAAGTPCHLHFEVRSRGHLLDPEPLVNSWVW